MRNGGVAAAAETPAAVRRLAQMGKAGRWLRNLFLPGRKSRKPKDRAAADADCQSVLSAPLPSHSQAPSGREKRRWSFRRPGAGTGASGAVQGPLTSSSSHCFSEAEVHVVVVAQEQDQQQQVAAAVVPEAASSTAGTVVVPLPAPSGRRRSGADGGRDAEAAAAVKIQAAFRSYLARKALCALRGMVRLQAMVRGQLVRRQANLTLRRMQALVHAQRRARAERLRLLEADDGASCRQQAANATTATPRPPHSSRRSPQHPRSRKALEAVERGSEENDVVRIVEVDDGAPRAAARRNSSSCCHYSTSITTPSRAPAKADLLCQKQVSPTPSALTDASLRTVSGRFDVDDASFASASEPTRVPSRRATAAWRADPPPFFPSYMANTESSRAKARSQSAPRQRLSSASETAAALAAAASPSPSCWERPPSRSGGGGGGGGSARRRASLDPLDLPGGGAPSRCMERCASRARAGASSVPGSECGSSSTVGHRGSARTGHGHACQG